MGSLIQYLDRDERFRKDLVRDWFKSNKVTYMQNQSENALDKRFYTVTFDLINEIIQLEFISNGKTVENKIKLSNLKHEQLTTDTSKVKNCIESFLGLKFISEKEVIIVQEKILEQQIKAIETQQKELKQRQEELRKQKINLRKK